MRAIFYNDRTPPPTEEEQALALRLQRHVEQLAREERNTAHPERLDAAARYIEQTLSALGCEVREQTFDADGQRVRNLEVSITPRLRSAQKPGLIVVGAHYDSALDSPGANDNASGSAAVIELARALRNAPPLGGHEIRLLWFVNEEAPHFKTETMGSLRHARELQARGEKVVAMLSLETIGYYSDEKGSQRYPLQLRPFFPDTGNFIGFVGDLGSRELVHRTIEAFRRNASLPSEGIAAPGAVPGIEWSDHWAYRHFGIPALMVTDTAPYRYPYYHSAADTPDKLAYDKLALVVKGLELALRELIAG
jgi:Zn-dependent M28 family amino/carboxypeptidase